jgi:hypothetical protein
MSINKCSLQKAEKKSSNHLEFTNMRSVTEHNDYSCGKKNHLNYVMTQENFPVNFYSNKMHLNYSNNVHSKSGNLSSLTINNNNRNIRHVNTVANTIVTINTTKPSSMRANGDMMMNGKKDLINSMRIKNNSVRKYSKKYHI